MRDFAQRNLGDDGRAFARGGLDAKIAADHFQTLPHAEQAEAFPTLGFQHTGHVEIFAIIFNLHANAAFRKFLDVHFHTAGLHDDGKVLLDPEAGAVVRAQNFLYRLQQL